MVSALRKNDAIHTILFVELINGIGDLLIALPAIQALGRSHPAGELTVLTLAPGGDLLQHDPLIHHIAYARRNTPTQKQHVRNSVEAFLAHHTFDLVVSDTTFDAIDHIIRTSDAGRCVTNLWRQPPPHERVAERFLRILLAEGLITPDVIAPPQVHLTAAERYQAWQLVGKLPHPRIFLFPDAGMPIKRWPLEHFIRLGQVMQQRYKAQVVVLSGSHPYESTLIARAIGGNVLACTSMSLRELAAVISYADLFVGPDTGPSHLAAILGVPTITLFGPSWHQRYGQAAPHINLQGSPECRERVIADFTQQTCWYSGVCPLHPWPTCVAAISPADVVRAAAPWLETESQHQGLSWSGPLRYNEVTLMEETGGPSQRAGHDGCLAQKEVPL
jgi:ADP-heptose:LPS heptosyltransferase